MKSFLIVAAASVALAACGGGDSSSEPSGVVYTGAQSATLQAGSFSEPTGALPFRMVVSNGTSVFITDNAGDQAVEARGTLSGNRFTATSNTTATEEGITCTFNWTYTGSISGNTASGSITGPVSCSDGTFPVTFNTRNGTFTGTTGASKALTNTGSIVEKVIQLTR